MENTASYSCVFLPLTFHFRCAALFQSCTRAQQTQVQSTRSFPNSIHRHISTAQPVPVSSSHGTLLLLRSWPDALSSTAAGVPVSTHKKEGLTPAQPFLAVLVAHQSELCYLKAMAVFFSMHLPPTSNEVVCFTKDSVNILLNTSLRTSTGFLSKQCSLCAPLGM